MKTETLIKTISEIPGGRFFRVRYMSKMPVKAKYEREGVSVIKLVGITARTGVAYHKIEAVAKTLNEDYQPPKETNWTWTVKDRIKYNRNTKKQYLVIAPVSKGSNTKSQYMLSDKNGNRIVDKEEIREYIIDSYWNKEPNRPINTIALDNVLSIH